MFTQSGSVSVRLDALDRSRTHLIFDPSIDTSIDAEDDT